ncbi:MAG: hypothetical protein J6Z44_03540 [Bacteroidales bacterium]|nr:hypothetical protein [Bacteroidales bacterium]
MERLRTLILSLILLLGICVGHAQVVQESDSIPDIPMFTDTTGIDAPFIDLSKLDTLPEMPVVTDTVVVDTIVPEDLYDPDETSIQFDIDTLYWGGDSYYKTHFINKIRDVMENKRGNVRILHIGGSHVQAGTMTHRIRKHLLDEYGGAPAARGLIFPYSAANNCNNPNDYRISKTTPFNLIRNVYKDHTFPLGAAGIAVWNADQMNSITVKMNAEGYDFIADTIVLLGEAHGWPIDPILKEDTIYHFPDSIDLQNGRYYFYFDRPVRDFTFYFPCSKGDTFVVNGILLQNERPGITLSSIGVNGAQTGSYLRCRNFVRDMQLLQPDLVIFGIGVNDAYGSSFDSVAFKNNYLELVRRIRSVNPDCAFIFFSNNDTWKKGKKGRYYVNTTGPAVAEVMYRLADLTGGAVWDQFAIMGGLKSMETWRKKGLAQKDRVHFTASGYNLVGDLFFDAFIRDIKPDRDEHR